MKKIKKRKKHEDRAYQQEIEDAIINYLFEEEGNPVAASPGGTGKSFVMAKLVKRFVTEWPGTRVLVLAMDSKLLNQNCNELLRYWPDAPAGLYSSGLKMRDTLHPIIFAGIQSVAKRMNELGKRHIIIIDEADQVSHKEETLYQKLIYDAKKLNPNTKIIGFTATPYRLGMGCLTNMDLWDKIVIDLTRTERFNWFIENRYLSPLTTKKPKKEIDITHISMKGGEFDQHDLQEAADTEELNKSVISECIKFGKDRKHWLIYSSGVEHGHKLTKLLNSRGISAVMLTGKDTVEYRDEMEDKFRSGEVRALVNCGLYLRGWDFPALDMIVWVRATQSTSLWVQGTVRGTRVADGKSDCLVLDFAGNIRRLGPINDPILPAPRRKGDGEKGEAPVKICPICSSYLHTRVRICPDCGYEFPPPETIKKNAADDAILRGDVSDVPIIEDFHVLAIRYKPTLSKNNNYYLRVTYSVGTTNFHESLFFDSDNAFMKRRIRKWWEYRGGDLPVPEGVDEAAERANRELKIPSVVRVDVAKKYPEVVGCDFDPDAKISDDIAAEHIPKPKLDKAREIINYHDQFYDSDDIPF